jgi:hypothetical protein
MAGGKDALLRDPGSHVQSRGRLTKGEIKYAKVEAES